MNVSAEGHERLVALAEMASEYWKLLRNFDRIIADMPEVRRPGLIAQAKFGSRRLEAILERTGLHAATFDGLTYSTNLPVTAVNADDFAGDIATIVEQTLEPAIVNGTTTVVSGLVYLRAAGASGANDVSRY